MCVLHKEETTGYSRSRATGAQDQEAGVETGGGEGEVAQGYRGVVANQQ